MSTILSRAAVMLAPTLVLLGTSFVSYRAKKTLPSFMQFAGASFMLVVVFAHICEGFSILAFMGWGKEGTIGHYLDLSSAILGVTLFAVGSVLRVASRGSA